ncbi:MAG: hypothetical protein ACI31A_04810 [Candidatus Limisoma sp.]
MEQFTMLFIYWSVFIKLLKIKSFYSIKITFATDIHWHLCPCFCGYVACHTPLKTRTNLLNDCPPLLIIFVEQQALINKMHKLSTILAFFTFLALPLEKFVIPLRQKFCTYE